MQAYFFDLLFGSCGSFVGFPARHERVGESVIYKTPVVAATIAISAATIAATNPNSVAFIHHPCGSVLLPAKYTEQIRPGTTANGHNRH